MEANDCLKFFSRDWNGYRPGIIEDETRFRIPSIEGKGYKTLFKHWSIDYLAGCIFRDLCIATESSEDLVELFVKSVGCTKVTYVGVFYFTLFMLLYS